MIEPRFDQSGEELAACLSADQMSERSEEPWSESSESGNEEYRDDHERGAKHPDIAPGFVTKTELAH